MKLHMALCRTIRQVAVCSPTGVARGRASSQPSGALVTAEAANDPFLIESSGSVTGTDIVTHRQLGDPDLGVNSDRVNVTFRGKDFSVPRGSKLRTAMLLNRVSPHNSKAQLINCRGLGTCGTCAVEIRGAVSPAEWTLAEQLRLNFPPHAAPNNMRLRLACQVACESDMEVVKRDRFWGQGSAILGPLGDDDEFSLPLGQMEFLLDPLKPPSPPGH